MLFGRPFYTIADQIRSAGVRYYSFFSFRVRRNVHCVTKNAKTCYSLDVRVTTALVFGQSVTEKVRSRTMLCFPPQLTYLVLQHCLAKEETQKTAHCHGVLCVQHSPTAVLLSTSFPLNHSPERPSWTHWLQVSGSHTAVWVCVVSQKVWRNQAATGWIPATHALTQRVKM